MPRCHVLSRAGELDTELESEVAGQVVLKIPLGWEHQGSGFKTRAEGVLGGVQLSLGWLLEMLSGVKQSTECFEGSIFASGI